MPTEDSGTSRRPTPAPPSGDATSPSAASVAPTSSDLPSARPLREVGTLADPTRYRVLGEQGRGGLGRVLRAYDRRLEREVALKELLEPSPEASARFVREVRLTARLQHPSIISIYEIGEYEDGAPFYAMKLVEGRPLDEMIASTPSFEARLKLVGHAAAVADAIAYAHDHGIIHRDLKPSNVLVGAFGETVVIDWGLAKDLRAPVSNEPPPPAFVEIVPSSTSVKTRTGEMMGSPAYMPPEQMRGENVDERADVFALGGILYQVLTGRAPYDGASFRDAVSRISAGRPVPVREREARVPVELAAIVDKAMATEPGDRYASAKELSADLARYRAGQLVEAHEYTAGVLFFRFVEKHRAAIGLVGAFVAALAVVGTISVRRVVKERNTARVAEAAADKARLEAESRAAELAMIHARSALDRDPAQAVAWARTYPKAGPAWREVAAIALEAQNRGISRWVHELFPRSWVRDMRVSADGARAVSCDELGEIAVVDLASGAISKLRWEGTPRWVAFAEGDRSLVAAGEDGTLVRFELPGGARREIAKVGGVRALAIAGAGGTVAITGGVDGVVRAIPIASGEPRVLATHEGAVDGIVVTSDGAVASAGRDGTVRFASVDRPETAIYRGERGTFRARISASADGKTFAVLEPGQRITVLDASAKVVRRFAGHEGMIDALAVSPDGAYVATGGFDRTVRTWAVSGDASRVLHGHTSEVTVLRWSPDGTTLASSGLDGDVRLWDPKTGESTRVLRGHVKNVGALGFGAGPSLVSADDGGNLRVFSLAVDRHRVLAGHAHDIVPMIWTPDGAHVVTGSNDKTLRVWPVRGGPENVYTAHTDSVRWLGVSRGNTVISAGLDDRLLAYPGAATGAPSVASRALAHARLPIQDISTNAESGTVAVATREGASIIDVETGAELALRGHAGAVRAVAVAKDVVASAGEDHTVRLWDPKTGAPVATLEGHATELSGLRFTRDGSRLASGDRDGAILVWQVATKTLLARLTGHDRRIVSMAFSPDGASLASASNDRTVRVWKVGSSEAPRVLPHDDHVAAVVFSPDGTLIASGGNDARVRVWDAQTTALRALHRQGNVICSIAFSPDGQSLASAGWDRVVRVWPVDASAMLPTDPDALLAVMAAMTNARATGR